MTNLDDELPGGRPVAPELLGRDVAYYREQGAAVAELLASLSAEERRGDPEGVDKLTRQRHLWHQLADELEAYLGHVDDDTPGLF